LEQKTGISQRIGYGASVYGSVTLSAAGPLRQEYYAAIFHGSYGTDRIRECR
jgi:hypothetical protein